MPQTKGFLARTLERLLQLFTVATYWSRINYFSLGLAILISIDLYVCLSMIQQI